MVGGYGPSAPPNPHLDPPLRSSKIQGCQSANSQGILGAWVLQNLLPSWTVGVAEIPHQYNLGYVFM